MTGVPFITILWCVPAFLALVLLPSLSRSARSHRDRFIHEMAPVAVSLATLSLAGLLIWIVCHRPPSFPGTGFLVLATAIGIGLLPAAFPSSGLIRGITLETVARFIAGMAWASCWPAARQAAEDGNPVFFLIGGVCGLLPDTLDQWLARFLRRIDVHIVPDPLAPDPRLVADALAQAGAVCHGRGRTVHVELYPGQDSNGAWHRFTVRMDTGHRLVTVSHAGCSASAPLPVNITGIHPFTFQTGDSPLSLSMECSERDRISLDLMPWRQGWSHSLILAAGLGLAAGLITGVVGGLIAAGACTLHILMDHSGFSGTGAFFPFSRRRTAGLQLLAPSREKGFNLGVIWLGVVLTGWTLMRSALPAMGMIPPVQVILFAGIIPAAGLMWWIRRRA